MWLGFYLLSAGELRRAEVPDAGELRRAGFPDTGELRMEVEGGSCTETQSH